jgi:hypothetical protein
MKCGNDECDYYNITDCAYMMLTEEMAHFCHECTECGWYVRVPRKSYEDTCKQTKENENG